MPSTHHKIPRDQLERAARMYRTNDLAAQALGVAASSIVRACKRYGIVPPNQQLIASTWGSIDQPATEDAPGQFICMHCGEVKCIHIWRPLFGYKFDLTVCTLCDKRKVKGPALVERKPFVLVERVELGEFP